MCQEWWPFNVECLGAQECKEPNRIAAALSKHIRRQFGPMFQFRHGFGMMYSERRGGFDFVICGSGFFEESET